MILTSLAWAEATVFWYSCVYNSVVSKSKRVAGLKLGILREKVVLYKTGKFFIGKNGSCSVHIQEQDKLTVQTIYGFSIGL